MSQSKYEAKNPLGRERQRSLMRESDQWADECDKIVAVLETADRPLRRKEIQMITMHGDNGARKRLNDLMNDGRVRTREDGPDGRVTYYEPSGRVHACDGDVWLPKPVMLR